jgi:predicted dehydrogenase
MNQGIHAIDALLWLTGPVEAVCAQTGIYNRNIEVENTASALLKFKNGAQGVLMGSTLSFTPEEAPEGDRIRIECENGSIVYANGKTTYFKNKEPGGFDVEMISLDDDGGEAISSGAKPENIDMEAHSTIVSDFITAVIEKKDPIIPGSSARLSVDTILAIYRSAKSNKWEKV